MKNSRFVDRPLLYGRALIASTASTAASIPLPSAPPPTAHPANAGRSSRAAIAADAADGATSLGRPADLTLLLNSTPSWHWARPSVTPCNFAENSEGPPNQVFQHNHFRRGSNEKHHENQVDGIG
jgi:hypothetical protein